MAKPKPEKTYAGGRWTKAKFFGFLRSNLRRAFVKWPPQYDVRRAARRNYHGDNPRQKYEFQCAACGHWFMAKHTAIDHKTPCGSLSDMEDLPRFTKLLFCDTDGLQLVCAACHSKKTQQERKERHEARKQRLPLNS